MPIHLPLDGDSSFDPTPAVPERVGWRTDRRRFLAGLALGGTSLLGGCSRRAGSRGNPGGWFAWLSDPHVAADAKAGLHGEVMAENLRAVVADIMKADDPPRGVVIDGDLAFHDGQAGDYRTLLATTRPLLDARIPTHLALGNHDDRANFREALGDHAASRSATDKQVSVVEQPDIRFLILDSMLGTNITGGQLGGEQLAWLASQLDRKPHTPAIVFVHHNLNADWKAALHDTTAFLDVLRPRKQAKMVVFGHTHVWNVQRIDGIHAINLPAVGYKFHHKQPLGWCVFRPKPGGGELELRCIGGDRRKDGQRIPLRWRTS